MIEIRLLPQRSGAYDAEARVGTSALAMRVMVMEERKDEFALEINRRRVKAQAICVGANEWWVRVGEETLTLLWRDPLPQPSVLMSHGDSLTAPMPGQVIAVHVVAGQNICQGDPVFILEAMKMEHTIRAPSDGTVVSVRFAVGDQAPAGALLVEIAPRVTEPVS